MVPDTRPHRGRSLPLDPRDELVARGSLPAAGSKAPTSKSQRRTSNYEPSAGLGVLVGAHRQLNERGRRLELSRTSRIVQRVLEITGLNDLLQPTAAPDDAHPELGPQPEVVPAPSAERQLWRVAARLGRPLEHGPNMDVRAVDDRQFGVEGYAFFGATGVVLGAIYMLRMFRTVMYGEATREENRTVRDVNQRETFVMAVILAIIIWIGVAPQPFLDIIGGDAAQQNMTELAQR